ncbi:unnamed protein product [Microthlaspi erraticum]|uniref:Uncharacterized protein n=1 Tax=Microthlaspi erraticum TaxID=1685480 RepID=A0A6D2HCY0_9BRAS|nr:unnamed protein product [Microthlaspi erraticum]
MVTATRRGIIRPSQTHSETHIDGSASTPVQIDEPASEPTIQEPLPPNITMLDEAADGGVEPCLEMVLFEGVVEAESFATAEDEPMADEEATAEKPEDPEIPRDAQTTVPIPNSAETLAPPPTDGATEAAVTTPPVVTVRDELNAAATEFLEPDASVPPRDSIPVASQPHGDEALDELNPGQPFCSEQKEKSLGPPIETTPKTPSSFPDQTRYALSDEEKSDEDACLITRKRKVLRSTGLPPPSKKLKEKVPESSPSPKPKASKTRSTPVKKAPARASSRAKGKAKQTEGSKSKKPSSLDRFAIFSSRGILDERIVDLKAEAKWGYPDIIIKGGFKSMVEGLGSYVSSQIVEFYAALPQPGDDSVQVSIRGYNYEFSPVIVNEFLNMQPLSDERKLEADADSVSLKTLAQLFTPNEMAEWAEIYSIGMTPCYASLVIVGSHKWMP